MALGGGVKNVVGLVMKEVLLLLAAGVALALPVSWLLARLVRTQLYGVEPRNAYNMALATLALVTVTLLAAYLPAARATRIDPMRALRYE